METTTALSHIRAKITELHNAYKKQPAMRRINHLRKLLSDVRFEIPTRDWEALEALEALEAEVDRETEYWNGE